MNEQYNEIDLLEIVKRIKRKWWLILLFAIISSSISFYVTTQMTTPIYQAKSTLFIGKESGGLSNISLSDLQVGNTLVSDYVQLISTNLVTEEVIQDLELNTTVAAFKSNIGVKAINNSRFMRIAYNHPDPEQAKIIVNKLSETLTEKALDIVGVKNIQIVDYAKKPFAPVSPSLKKNLAISIVGGIVIALMIIVLEMAITNTVSNEEEIEAILKVSVLGSVPKFRSVG